MHHSKFTFVFSAEIASGICREQLETIAPLGRFGAKQDFEEPGEYRRKAPANKVRKTGELIRHKGCGLPHSLAEECLFQKLNHKYYNHEDVEFKDSTKDKEWFQMTGKYTLSKK